MPFLTWSGQWCSIHAQAIFKYLTSQDTSPAHEKEKTFAIFKGQLSLENKDTGLMAHLSPYLRNG